MTTIRDKRRVLNALLATSLISFIERAFGTFHAEPLVTGYHLSAIAYALELVEGLLNQARKYRVGMVVAHQNLDQLSQKLRATIAASTSIKLAGGVSAKDADAYAKETNSEPEFVRSMRKRSGSTEFACWIKNVTPQAIRLSVPLGYVESLPVIDDGEYDNLIAANRARYCTTRAELADILRPREAPGPAEEFGEVPPVRREAPREEFVKRPEAPQAPPATREVPRDVAPPGPPAPARPPIPEIQPERASEARAAGERAMPPLGRGGAEHTYLQELIKGAAQERGYHATIEEQILEGAGRVDVSLVRGGTKIACEISITSTPEQELQNIRKCLNAGYNEVIVVASEQRRLHALRKFVMARLEEGEVDRARYLLPEATVFHLNELAAAMEPKETTVRGYRVKVEHKVVGAADAQDRRRAIAQVIARSLKTHRTTS